MNKYVMRLLNGGYTKTIDFQVIVFILTLDKKQGRIA